MNSFKKLTSAVAISAALGLSGPAHAIIQGEPGDALLVPLVTVDTANSVNTLVGLTFPSIVGADPVQSLERFGAPGFSTYVTARNSARSSDGHCVNSATGAPTSRLVHWFFFSDTSTHLINSQFAVTCDDFYGFDWRTEASNAGGLNDVDGLNGYLVFTDENARSGISSSVSMFGDAAQVRGNWASAAFIPVIPLVDGDDAGGGVPNGFAWQGFDEVVYNISGVPSDVNPLTAGMPLDNDDGDTIDGADFDMRYFLDPSLGGGTDLVVWMDRNCRNAEAAPAGDGCDRRAVPVDVFDTEEQTISDNLDLSLEVNVIDAATLNGTVHTDADGSVDSGFVYVRLGEVEDVSGMFNEGPDTSAVAFSLIEFSAGGNPTQVQTALAHERGIVNFGGAGP